MGRSSLSLFPEQEARVYTLISRHAGLRAREIAKWLGLDKTEVNRLLVSSALMREMCYKDADYRWHALIPQVFPHEGLYEFSGWYGLVREFLAQEESAWLKQLEEGCVRIGRSLNDTRGLIHSFLDCRQTLLTLFADLAAMAKEPFQDWEICFEFRLNRARMIRVYADVLVITPRCVFSLEFKMKPVIDPEEVLQAAKYAPYLELIFGSDHDILPALVLTRAADLFEEALIGTTDAFLPVCSGDMLFNVFDHYLGFLG